MASEKFGNRLFSLVFQDLLQHSMPWILVFTPPYGTNCVDFATDLLAKINRRHDNILESLQAQLQAQTLFNAVRRHIGSRRWFLQFVRDVEAAVMTRDVNIEIVQTILTLVRDQNRFPLYLDQTGLVLDNWKRTREEHVVEPGVLTPSRKRIRIIGGWSSESTP